MITSRIYAMQEGFVTMSEKLEARTVEALDAAAATAADVAEANASIDLQLEIVLAHELAEGYSAGIKSRRQSDSEGKTTPIAPFFDAGTLGKRRKKLKRNRKESWTVTRRGTAYTARRGDVDGKGIAPERFFSKARAAGRARLVEKIHEPF